MMPKSTAASRPRGVRNRFPGCMSAWKKPSRTAWRRKDWIRTRPRSGKFTPERRKASTSDKGAPSIHSRVMTSRAQRSQSTLGTRKSSSPWVFSANSDAAAASSRKSISILTERARVSTTPTGLSLRASVKNLSAKRAAKNMSPRSRWNRRSIPGRSTFTATGRATPSSITVARWTCATEAAATGSLNSTKTSLIGRAKAFSITATATARGKGSILS